MASSETYDRPPPVPSGPARPVRQAASVVVVRDGAEGIEVLLMHRADKGDHFSGAWAFPGGALDAADRKAHGWCDGLDDGAASARLLLGEGGLDYWVAAIRECFEEAGLLFARDAAGQLVAQPPGDDGPWGRLRHDLHHGACRLDEVCRMLGVRLAADELAYVAHWVTPPGVPKRFDTRFFIAALPPGQRAAHDAIELQQHEWLRPQVVLAPENARRLMAVTRHLIETVGRFPNVRALMAWARSVTEVQMVMRRRARGPGGDVIGVMVGDPAYDEIAWLDPDGKGHMGSELQPGIAVRLSPRVRRLTAPDGCNTYIVDTAEGASIVIDAGADDPRHGQALRAAAGRIDTVLSTGANDQPDPGAHRLAQLTGARVVEAEPGDRLDIGGAHLAAVAAPDGGIEWLLEEEGLLFTSTHEGSGDAFDDPIAWIAPRRGFLIRAR